MSSSFPEHSKLDIDKGNYSAWAIAMPNFVSQNCPEPGGGQNFLALIVHMRPIPLSFVTKPTEDSINPKGYPTYSRVVPPKGVKLEDAFPTSAFMLSPDYSYYQTSKSRHSQPYPRHDD